MDGCACLFFILGLGLNTPMDDMRFYDTASAQVHRLRAPLARMEVGYEWKNGIEFSLEHTSQVTVTDTGLNVLWLKKRWTVPPDREGQ